MFWQLMMLCPLLMNIPCIGVMARYSAYLKSFMDVDCEVLHRTLLDMEDRQLLICELRDRIMSRLSMATSMAPADVIDKLFDHVDSDHSGFIDRMEFKDFLSALGLSYSDERFNRLYKAVDINGDFFISKPEINELVFPQLSYEEKLQQNKITEIIRKKSLQRQSILDTAAIIALRENHKPIVEEDEEDEEDGDEDDAPAPSIGTRHALKVEDFDDNPVENAKISRF